MARRKKKKSYNEIVDQLSRINDYLESTGRARYVGNNLGGSEGDYVGTTQQAQRVINIGKQYRDNARKAALKKETNKRDGENYDKVTGRKVLTSNYWFPEERAANVPLSYSSRAGSKG